MKRYYAHYTFIYPDTYLKNMVVELGDDNKITCIMPFEKEIERTEFFSGYIFFIPSAIIFNACLMIDKKKQFAWKKFDKDVNNIDSSILFHIYDEDLNKII